MALSPSTSPEQSREETDGAVSGTTLPAVVKAVQERHMWHGVLGEDDGWAAPRVAATSDMEARPGYHAFTATEFLDSKEVLQAKVRLLADLVRRAARQASADEGGLVVYTGAGISTAAGVPDYASRARGSVAPHLRALGPGGRPTRTGRLGGLASIGSGSRCEAQPTRSHMALAALEQRGLVQHWLQQNHDRLAQKAGFPQVKLNEIHGAWGDLKNPVLMMDDALRPDLLAWLNAWRERASLVLAVGTSLCGMTSDCVAESVVERSCSQEGAPALGLVIVNLQQTRLDAACALRIWGLADEVLSLLCKELACAVPDREAKRRGEEWVQQHPSCKYSTKLRKATDPL